MLRDVYEMVTKIEEKKSAGNLLRRIVTTREADFFNRTQKGSLNGAFSEEIISPSSISFTTVHTLQPSPLS